MTITTKKLLKRIDACVERYPELADCAESIVSAFYRMKNSFVEGGKLLLCGNGGSAADADHISGELLKGFGHVRPLKLEWHEKLGDELATNLQGTLPAIPLTIFNALGTAYCNDCNAEYTFAQLTWGLGRPGDVLLAISTSGNSKNVLHALKVAKAKGLYTIGLTGKSGGTIKDMVDVSICVPENEVYKVQELHLPIYHTLCFMLEDAFFGDGSE